MTERYGWDQTPTPDLGLDVTKAPADIQKLYKWIIEKMYGEDVASAYGQAMVLTGILAKNAEAMSLFTSGRMDALTTYVDDMLIEMTDKDIVSAPEIIQMRDGETTANDRLVRDYNNVTSQLADIATYIKPTGTANDTSMVQAAFNNFSHIIVKAGTYFIDGTAGGTPEMLTPGIKVPSNRNITFEEGAIFKVIPNAATSYRVLDLYASENVVINNPTLIGERAEHTGTTGEHGHGIVLATAKNVTINNPVLKDFWGDGIAIYGAEDSTINNIYCDNNRRQGISIIRARNFEVNGGVIKNTNGTSPESGIDIESNYDTDFLENIRINNVTTIGNKNCGILVVLNALATKAQKVSIFINNHVDHGATYGFAVSGFQPQEILSGSIVLNNPNYSNNMEGISIGGYASTNTPEIQIISPTIKNPRQNVVALNDPRWGGNGIHFHRETTYGGITKIGNVSVTNPIIIDDRPEKKMLRGIYFTDMKDVGFENIKIIDPIIISGTVVPQNKIDMNVYSGIELYDRIDATRYHSTNQYISVYNWAMNTFTNTGATTVSQINLNALNINKMSMEFINATSHGIIIVPPSGQNILPLSKIPSKFIRTTEIGASIKICRLNETSYRVESMTGTWTPEV